MNNAELTALKTEMLERLYDADFNLRYHDSLGRRYGKLDLSDRVILAVAAVIVFVCAGSWPVPQYPKLWSTIAGAVSLLSTTVIPLFKWNKLIPRIESERLRWIQLKNDYENLWNDAKATGDWDEAKKELNKLRKKDVAAEKSGGIIPEHKGLLAKCQQEVIIYYEERNRQDDQSQPSQAA